MTFTKLTPYSTTKLRIAYSGIKLAEDIQNNLNEKFQIFLCTTHLQFNQYLNERSLSSLPEVILLEADEQEHCFTVIENIRKSPLLKGLIIVLIAPHFNRTIKQKALKCKIHDFYVHPFSFEQLAERLEFLVRFKLIKPNLLNLSEKVDSVYKMPFSKRLFDIIFSLTFILLLTPLFLFVALIIVIESRGNVVYKSKRVGTGYKIFDFYKFRSMHTNSDQLLIKLSSLNQYEDEENKVGKSVFVKLRNDPRVTPFGAFIRKTSIDELPQLFNILKGDMSVVGNRPLPLYEAEKLTSNEWATRFLGPAGLTGLWQISKRGRGEMSERERKKLDNFYALNYSFWFDFNIILRTFPAMFQKEKV